MSIVMRRVEMDAKPRLPVERASPMPPTALPATANPGVANAERAGVMDRLGSFAGDDSPERLLQRLKEFKQAVHTSLHRSSSAYQILHQIHDSGLRDCVKCTREIENRLASNPHYQVLGKLLEAERLLTQVGGLR